MATSCLDRCALSAVRSASDTAYTFAYLVVLGITAALALAPRPEPASRE